MPLHPTAWAKCAFMHPLWTPMKTSGRGAVELSIILHKDTTDILHMKFYHERKRGFAGNYNLMRLELTTV